MVRYCLVYLVSPSAIAGPDKPWADSSVGGGGAFALLALAAMFLLVKSFPSHTFALISGVIVTYSVSLLTNGPIALVAGAVAMMWLLRR